MPLYLTGKYNNKFYLCNSRDKKTDITPFSERIQNVCRTQGRTYLLAGRKGYPSKIGQCFTVSNNPQPALPEYS